MELYMEILKHEMKKEHEDRAIVELSSHAKEIAEGKCYQALEEIKKILEDEDLEDASCFQRIEKIVMVFEDLGSGCGTRHDFG